MSRCFPFPPPGYEKLSAEFSKEKGKEKKERKDKGKKDREKKEKDGNREKQRDKKDRKEKRREKKEKNRHKKDASKEKEKGETNISQDLPVAAKPEGGKDKELHLEGHGYGGRSYTGVSKYSSSSHYCNGAQLFGYGASHTTLEAKFVEELNNRLEEDGEISEDRISGRFAIMEKGGHEEKPESSVRNHSVEMVAENGSSRCKGVEFRNMGRQLLRDELTRKPPPQKNVKLSEGKVEGTPRTAESQNHRNFLDTQKFNKADGGKRTEELEDRDMEININDKNQRNERKMVEILTIKSRKNGLEKSKDSEMTYSSDATVTSHKSDAFPQSGEDVTLNKGNIRKRKDINNSGFLHDSEVRPYKIQAQTLHHFNKNGRKPVSSEVFSKTPDNVVISGNVQFHEGNLPMKTTVEPLNASYSKNNASVDVMSSIRISVDPKVPCQDSGSVNEGPNVPMVEDLLAEASRRPPHRDSKYLSWVLRVPDVGQWSECDDQEWLFSKKDPPLQKAAPEATSARVETRVWSKAIHIESADIYALPYVIPY